LSAAKPICSAGESEKVSQRLNPSLAAVAEETALLLLGAILVLGFGSNATSRQRLSKKNLDFGVDTP
jgi:hypothetical protein